MRLLLLLLFAAPLASAQTWAQRTVGGGGLDLEGIAFNPSGSVGLIVTDDGPVLRSTDGGATWAAVGTGADDLRDVDWAGDDVVWVAGRDANGAVSTDGGLTWTLRPTGSADRTEAISAVSATEAWVANRKGGIRHTTDGGVTWSPQASGTGEDMNDIQMLNASTGYIAASSNVILKTTNGGATWTNVSASGAEGDGLYFLNASTGWAVSDAGAIWFTADGGATWTLQPSGTSAAFNRVHFADAEHGWAVADGGVIVAFTVGTTDTENAATADAFELAAPAPNPFADRTAFGLDVEAAQAVRVEVFDVLGRRVAVLHDGMLAAGQTHRFVFEAAGLPGGLYFVRATGEASAQVRRVVHLD